MLPLKVTEPIDSMPFNPTKPIETQNKDPACLADPAYCKGTRFFQESIILMASRLTIRDELWNPFEDVSKSIDFADVAEITFK